MKLFGSMKKKNNKIYIGNYSANEIADKFKTPVYIIDEKGLIDNINKYKNNFKSDLFQTEIIYASKAMLNIYMADLINKNNLSIDVVSGGEIYTVLKSNFNRDKIYFHGNNKLTNELELAIKNKIGTIIIDNINEYNNLEKLLQNTEIKQNVMLRVNPGIEAHTHEYINTSKNDSKFGENIHDPNIYELIRNINNSKKLNFKGLHCHIGSQIFEEDSFFKAVDVMTEFIKKIKDNLNININELNLGGGFGIYYTEEDTPFEIDVFLKKYIKIIEENIRQKNIKINKILIEPGRSLISNFGSTLYTIGSTKKTLSNTEYLFVDGGMTDNIRPALYQAKYEAVIANKINDKVTKTYTIAGKCCESGDVLIKDIVLPQANSNDLLLINSTGAYNYSMSTNYNMIEKPAMIFINQNKINIAVQRQTYNDMLSNNIFNRSDLDE